LKSDNTRNYAADNSPGNHGENGIIAYFMKAYCSEKCEIRKLHPKADNYLANV